MKICSLDGFTTEELLQYTGCSVKAADFDTFWKDAVAELESVERNVELTPASYQCHSADCFDLRFTGVGGARICAKYLRPKTGGKHPCVLWFHGYSIRSAEWTMYLPYIAENMCVLALDCRGQGGDSQDICGIQTWAFSGEILRGIREGADHLTYRRIYLDALALAKIAETFPEIDKGRMASYGISQGGAISVACSALYGNMKATVCGSNFLSDFGRAVESDYANINSCSPYKEIGEYLRRFDPNGSHLDETMTALSYIDCANFASMIKNPTLMCMTMKDRICPPASQFAVYNRLAGEKKAMIFYYHDHEDDLPGWYDAMMQFLNSVFAESTLEQ